MWALLSIISSGISGLAFFLSFFFFNDTAPTEIYTLSLHDALPISWSALSFARFEPVLEFALMRYDCLDRKSTRLNSSHSQISYAVFCLKKKKNKSEVMTINPTKLATIITWKRCRPMQYVLQSLHTS